MQTAEAVGILLVGGSVKLLSDYYKSAGINCHKVLFFLL